MKSIHFGEHFLQTIMVAWMTMLIVVFPIFMHKISSPLSGNVWISDYIIVSVEKQRFARNFFVDMRLSDWLRVKKYSTHFCTDIFFLQKIREGSSDWKINSRFFVPQNYLSFYWEVVWLEMDPEHHGRGGGGFVKCFNFRLFSAHM